MRSLKLALAIGAVALVQSASAFDPLLVAGGVWLTEYIVAPVSYVLGCAFAFSPPVRAFGDQDNVYGLDWGSLACHAGNVYGLQMGFCGGSFENRLYGLQLGILASGYAVEELPFDEYHFFNLDSCRMNGVQIGTFAAKTATANGVQLSAVYTEAYRVNGLQLGLVNRTTCLHGLQVGLFNSAERGCGLQVGVLNRAERGLGNCLPILNFVYGGPGGT